MATSDRRDRADRRSRRYALAFICAIALVGADPPTSPPQPDVFDPETLVDAMSTVAPRDWGLFDTLGGPGRHASDAPIQTYGWVDMGYTSASTATGRLAVAPVPNRFGNAFLLNQAALVITRPLAAAEHDELSWGFAIHLFAGADAAYLQGPGDIHSNDPRFGFTIRQLNTSFHLPILSEGGVDLVLGRQGSWLGYESYMAPNRPLYSLTYQWNFAEDGSDTGVWTTWHTTDRLDLRYAMTLGSNTFFVLRGTAPCHLLQTVYRVDDAGRTVLTGSVILGNQAIGNAIPFLHGRLDTVVELRAVHAWSDRFTQVVQANLGWSGGIPVLGVGQWYGVLGLAEYRLAPRLDTNLRWEWFDDVNGSRTGIPTNYFALTMGLNLRPTPWFSIRPELRGDFAGLPAFGRLDSLHRHRDQLTFALECLVRF